MRTSLRGVRLAVVGSGIIGLSIGAAAAAAGAEVTIVEREGQVGGAATRASFAWVNARDHGTTDYAQLRRRAVAMHHDLRPRGAFHPVGATTGWSLPGEGWLDVDAWQRDRMAALLAAGGRALTSTTVAKISSVAGGVRLDTVGAGPSLDVDRVVIAAGAGTADLAGAASHRIGTAAGPLGFLATIEPDRHLPDVSHLPQGPGHRLHVRHSPSGGVAVQVATLEATHLSDGGPSSVSALAAAVRQVLAEEWDQPAWLSAQMSIAVAARPHATDGLPLVGSVSGGRYLALTHSGVTLAPLIAEWVCRELAGETVPELDPFRP